MRLGELLLDRLPSRRRLRVRRRLELGAGLAEVDEVLVRAHDHALAALVVEEAGWIGGQEGSPLEERLQIGGVGGRGAETARGAAGVADRDDEILLVLESEKEMNGKERSWMLKASWSGVGCSGVERT